MSDRRAIVPGATLGVMGGGQLGRMFIQAAHRLGYRVHLLSPDAHGPAGQVADKTFVAEFDDLEQVAAFARSVQAVTFEFENVPSASTLEAARHSPVRPGGDVLHLTQNRLREKSSLQLAGLPVTPFAAVRSAEDLDAAIAALGVPAILKTASWGYDGRGQARVVDVAEAHGAREALGNGEMILEKMIAFEREVSVVAARGLDGEIRCFEPFENEHVDHILDRTRCPARIPDAVRAGMLEVTRNTMAALEVVGVLCVEFFVAPDGQFMINELAPRPHNSGHLTVDACETSQFEQQVRAICGLPLGSTRLHRPAAMANLLGDLWLARSPQWTESMAFPDVKMHLYGKHDARLGRKMGHLTAMGMSSDEAVSRVTHARDALRKGSGAGAALETIS